jgi:hypothetical protein
MQTEENAFWDWYTIGVDKGWITAPFCSTHDGGTEFWTDEEQAEWEDGGDPCMTVARVKFLG